MNQFMEKAFVVSDRPDPADVERTRYLRSYLAVRIAVGVLGFLLPFVVVLGDGLWFDGRFPRDSLSAYYWSGTREVFVGGLCATAIVLVTYKIVEWSPDNLFSIIAGVAAAFVALFPTASPPGAFALTPLQDRLSETAVKVVHFSAAGVFILSLGVICVFFGVRDGKRPDRDPVRQHRGRVFHFTCAGVIGAAVLFILVVDLGLGWDRALLVGEIASVWAFSASWLAKGLELDALRSPSRRRHDPAPPATSRS
jgi:hypothetical protein